MSTLVFDQTIVANMVDDALALCAARVGLKDKEQAEDALRRGDCSVCEQMRNGLTQKVAEYLGSVDSTVQAVYSYESEYATQMDEALPPRPNLSPGLSLIARVSRKSAALSSVVASMRSALAEEHRRLGCPKADATCCELDVVVVDEDEVQKRTGYGALVNSLYVRPIEVWRR